MTMPNETVNLILGRTYVTEDGMKVYILGVLTEVDNTYTFIGRHPSEIGAYFGYDANGKCIAGFRPDLVKEWKEPRVWKRGLYVCEREDEGTVFFLLDTPERIADDHRILARKQITITEGEGLDD